MKNTHNYGLRFYRTLYVQFWYNGRFNKFEPILADESMKISRTLIIIQPHRRPKIYNNSWVNAVLVTNNNNDNEFAPNNQVRLLSN